MSLQRKVRPEQSYCIYQDTGTHHKIPRFHSYRPQWRCNSKTGTPKWSAPCLTVHRAPLKYLRASKKLGETLTVESILQKSPKVYRKRGRIFEEGKRRLILSYVVCTTKLISLKPAAFFYESSSSTECLNIPFRQEQGQFIYRQHGTRYGLPDQTVGEGGYYESTQNG